MKIGPSNTDHVPYFSGMEDQYDITSLLVSLESVAAIQSSFDSYQRECFPDRPPEFFALELAGEAGEVANNEKKMWKGRPVSEDALADEAADVFIALVNYANARGIDLKQAVQTKLSHIENIRRERKQRGEDY